MPDGRHHIFSLILVQSNIKCKNGHLLYMEITGVTVSDYPGLRWKSCSSHPAVSDYLPTNVNMRNAFKTKLEMVDVYCFIDAVLLGIISCVVLQKLSYITRISSVKKQLMTLWYIYISRRIEAGEIIIQQWLVCRTRNHKVASLSPVTAMSSFGDWFTQP